MNDPAPLHRAFPRRGRSLLRRLLPAIAALLVLIGLGAYLLVTNALSQDADVQARSRTFTARSLEQQRNEVGRNIINYSKWGEAYRHLHLTVDKVWADDHRNVGDIPFDLYGYNGVWVVDGAGRTVYGVIDGKPTPRRITDWLQGDVAGLLAAARESDVQDGSVVRALEVGGLPAIAAAATITPGWDSSIPVAPGTPSVMMFVTVLDPAWLARLSEQYGVPALTASRGPLPGHESMPLLDSPSIHLNWHPPQPGRDLLRQTLPLFAGGVLLMLGVLVLLLRNALASARQIDAQLQALQASQAELQGSERRFRDMAETSSDWLWEADAQGRLTYLSDRFLQVTGHHRSDWLGRPLADLLRPEGGQPLQPWLERADRQGPADAEGAARGTLLCRIDDRAGLQRICRVTARAIGEGQGFRGTATDLTDEWQAQARVRHLSLHDTLTGLPNRRRLHQFLATLLESDGLPEPLALLCLDLDRFKPINDALGHALGDRVLQEVARRLQALLGPQDIAARLGGDEFVLVLAGAQEPGDIGRRCAAVVAALCEPFAFDGQTVCIGTSIGVVQAPLHARTAQELLRKGDIALYDAKAAGRNTWRCYTDALDAQAAARLQMEQDLRVALRTGQMRLHYQPCYAVDGGALRSLEALVRWQHPVRGMLQPEEFLPLAQETGLIRPLGEWVLHTACRDAAGWPSGVRVSVNLSAGQFGSAGPQAADLPSVVAEALRESGLPARRLELEINEGVLLTHGDEALRALAALKQQGVWLTLADFASGYSSLACLRHLLPDGIKIGRGFVAQLPERAQDRAIVQAVGALAHALGVSVRAEGVETRAQLDCLMRQPCDEVQGFHFSDALPPGQLGRLWGAAAASGPGSVTDA
ncbi:bifunctional diguanylate cyclase/phosphodiesterase [Paracidovorax avenae]|uniref:bifunctional diguanylate cyclase/phosphodiesterase n=1 Tax=Paracidovorax avenae TaxID=80867 RepID=UPI000D15928F|nr:EAL domain-containing protein [Paracidovorax avenae]AVT21247.1 bifunctional diguanylate cyclase/phosphodiesterase [Paracidovorax avenae]